MNVRRLRLLNFACHDDTDVELLERGLVVVTGDNEAGKSMLVEAVATACWGKTIRGTPAWRDGARSIVEVVVAASDGDALVVERSKAAKGDPKLSWRRVGETVAVEYATTTKAQAVLDALLPSFDVWRRSHVFSSADAAHLSLATDGERKRLIEPLLGVDRFDPALKACRADLSKAEAAALRADAAIRECAASMVGAGQRRADAEKALAALGPRPSGQTELDTALVHQQAEAAVRAALEAAQRVEAELVEERELVAEAASLVRQARQAQRSVREGACPTCLRDVDAAQAGALRETFAGKARRANEAYERCAEVEAKLQGEARELADALEAARAEERRIWKRREREAATRAERERWVATKAQLDAAASAAANEDAELRRRAKGLAKERDALAADVAMLRAVERVLGLRGVRAQVLGSALGGISRVATSLLAKLGRPGRTVRLAPDDAGEITLEVAGMGGGRGYKGGSGGERRRVDVALMLALAEVAGASAGRGVGTLWFDEVLDCLDDDGVEAVASLLGRLARERCVVVVTHSEALARRLDATLRLRVVKGLVT